eukprot:TRINITY_DN20280_c0_g1_i1.p1 TRINITY_DN20280_c0_g1~~TRINITY_DN20280_c0_g1_i1.p1  ORF type:complete len:247 (+),score=23.82 TRINITY_DN20280_c0_g1_i1:41-742(+)
MCDVSIFVLDMTEGVWSGSDQLGEAHDAVSTARLMHTLGDSSRKSSVIGVGGSGAIFMEEEKGYRENPWPSCEGLAISKAVGMGLCCCNKQDDPDLSKEINIVAGTAISKKEHIALMNAAYVATSAKVKINVFWIGSSPVDIPLQQAVACTSGICIPLPNASRLLQVLLQTVLTPSVAGSLSIPPPSSVDTRISCFKDNTLVEIGLVCPVCFSVYGSTHSNMERCDTCSTALT